MLDGHLRLGHLALLVAGFGAAVADNSRGSNSASVLTSKKPLEIRVPPDWVTPSTSIGDHACSTSSAATASPDASAARKARSASPTSWGAGSDTHAA
jgi:hypothetical protein